MRNYYENNLVNSIDRRVEKKKQVCPAQPPAERVRVWKPTESSVCFETMTVIRAASTFDFAGAISREMRKAGIS